MQRKNKNTFIIYYFVSKLSIEPI